MFCRQTNFLQLALCIVIGFITGCVTVQPTWQPANGQATVPIHLYGTAIHTILSLPASDQNTSSTEEWALGQKLWFYDARTTNSWRVLHGLRTGCIYTFGFLRAGFWPSQGIIEIVHPRIPLAQREASLVRQQWTFYVSPQECAAIRAWLRGTFDANASPIFSDNESVYFECRKKYWAFYNCHHYTAHALRAGGIPVGTGRCWIPWLFWWQLNKFEQSQALLPK